MQPLHGIAFALLHLACMRPIARIVPQGLEGTAQAVYGVEGIGVSPRRCSPLSPAGALYARLCALALPLTWRLSQPGFGRNPQP